MYYNEPEVLSGVENSPPLPWVRSPPPILVLQFEYDFLFLNNDQECYRIRYFTGENLTTENVISLNVPTDGAI